MKKPIILVTSARNALRYVIKHFCEPGVTEYPEETDTYAAISIQDTYCGGFGFELKKNKYCKDVLTLFFDDIEEPEQGLHLISLSQAIAIVDFIKVHAEDVDTILIHCFAGVSRSRAVGIIAGEILGIKQTYDKNYNHYVYDILKRNMNN